jgi:hypothetical protein
MKNKLLIILCVVSSLLITNNAYSQEQSDSLKVETSESLAANKTEKNRNEMLNAENSPGPRNVNIGLPFTGDLVILENDLPVVYYYYPTSPLVAWRKDNSLAGMGLFSFTETAIKTGKVGFAVQSNDRGSSNSFRGYASIYGNSHGSSRYDMTITGPIKDGWGYMASFYQNFDRGNGVNFGFTPWFDQTTMLKGSLQKKYKGGDVRVLYKFVDSKTLMGNYSPLIYNGNGKTSEYDGFRLGKDSYLLGNGLIPYYDAYTGEAKLANLDDDNHSRSQSHNIYIDGNHRFNGGFLDKWKLSYSAMYSSQNSPFSVNFPISLMAYMPDQDGYGDSPKYTYHGVGQAGSQEYTGPVQYVRTTIIPQSDNKYITGRAELTKKTGNHDLRFGLNYQNNHRKFVEQSSMYLMTVAPNPVLLDYYTTVNLGGGNTMTVPLTNNAAGVLPAGFAGGYGFAMDERYSKTALYASDDIQITNRWNLNLGFRLEHQNKYEKRDTHGYYYTPSQIPGGDPSRVFEKINDVPLVNKDFKNDFNYVGAANTVFKITSKFGLLAEFSYNSWADSYWDYEQKDANGQPVADANDKYRQTKSETFRNNVINFGGGVYFNQGNTFSIVSKVTRITKENVRYTNAKITNPTNKSESVDFSPIFYDISTLGWTTDIVATPFRNFNIHFLLTLQNPQYKNFKFGAFGIEYDYNDNIIPELSKVLMEIDPSYTFMDGKMRGWVSLRYFGKQYGNPTNAFYYNARWENFAGLDYNISRNFNLKLQVTNFLDQAGVRGGVQGADQITDATPYTDRIIVANSIRPRTIELTANVKF